MAENPNSILNLDPDAFVAALDELGIYGEERNFLTDQYYAQNRALPMTQRPEGKTVRNILPIATPEGMTGAEALMSGDFDFTVPELLRGLYEGPAEAINVASAIGKGVPVTEEQVQQAGQIVPEMVTGIGPATFAARSLARGLEMPDPTVVSMSGVGPRGMGDNQGPPLESFDEDGFLRMDDVAPAKPQRYINPNTGMYSPSYEASKALKQEVGTPQQMRSMLLKAGAKEEELTYSGFDDWLKGRDKVTRQEIEDVLRVSAAGNEPSYDVYTGMKSPSSNMPYAQQQYSAKGITGSEGEDPFVLRRRLAADMQSQAIDERDARMMGELQGRGYRPVEFADGDEVRAMLETVRQTYDNAVPGGLMPDGGRVPPARVLNTLTRVVGLMDFRDNMAFESPEIQRTLRGLTEDTDFLIGPSGLPEFSEEIIRRELPDESITPYFGSLPTAERVRIGDQVEAMPEQELADRLGISVEDVLNSFDEGDTQYAPYVVPGMRNYKENLYTYEDAGRGVMSGLESLGAQTFEQPHFGRMGSKSRPIMFHTRTGELQTPEGPAYHLFEAQSDIAQTYRDRPGDFVAPGAQVQTPKMDKDQKAVLQDYLNRAKEVQGLNNDVSSSLDRLYDNYLDEGTGGLRKDDPGYKEMAAGIREGRERWSQLSDDLIDFETRNKEFFSEIENFYGDVPTMRRSRVEGGDFSTGRLEDILAGKAKPKKGFGLAGKSAALPFSSSTNRWLDAALKSELIKAAKSDAAWFTLPKGKDVVWAVGGDELGQEKFYEQIVPQRLKKLAKDFLPGEVEIAPIKAKGYGSRADEYDVLGMRLTPEIKKAILEGGLPSFAKGGPVQGSSLDVDVFALR
jgi:hypothetical protein